MSRYTHLTEEQIEYLLGLYVCVKTFVEGHGNLKSLQFYTEAECLKDCYQDPEEDPND